MNRSSRVVLFVLSLCSAGTYGQVSSYTSPLDVPTDPRSIAMGESFVALAGNPTALMSNPAGLVGLQGFGVSYAQRSMNWMRGLESFQYHGANAYLAVTFW